MVWRANNRTVITHTFLDNGSSATFCTESLVKKLGVEGTKGKVSRSTLEKKNGRVESYLIRDLVVSGLDENDLVSLPALYTRPEIPVCEENIPTQEDVDQWPHPDDVPETLDLVEIRHGENGGPYASRTRSGWAVNGPLGRCRHGSQAVSSLVKVDPQLQHMVENF